MRLGNEDTADRALVFFFTSLIEKEQSKLNVQFIGMLILIIIIGLGTKIIMIPNPVSK